MVRSLHEAGMEVILDVVYNHTAEGNQLGPTLSFKGLDNAAYYRLVDDDLRYYMDYTGTGNSLNVRHPHSLQLIMDSLRYWVTEMHVDGFRFDLAAALAREFYDVDRLSTFFELVQQDPVVSQVKLIAEPWDVGPGGYQVGGFPPQWTEWNGKYRDTVRDFWRGEPSLGEFASRLVGLLRPLRELRAPARWRASTSSPPTTASRCATWCPTTTSTTTPTARTATTARATTAPGTTASRVRPTTPRSSSSARASSGTSSPRCCSARASRCCCTATRPAAPSRATTTPTPRTPRSPGCTGTTSTSRWWSSPPRSPGCAATTRRSAASASSPVRRCAPATASASTTSSGCTPTATRWRTATGPRPTPGRSGCTSTATASPALDARGRQIVDDHFLLYFNASGDDVPLTLPPEEYAAAWDVEIDTAGREPDEPLAAGCLVDAGRAQRARAARAHAGRGRARLLGRRLGRGLPGLPGRQGRMSGSPRGTTTAMRTPVSTYRLQITADFDLFAAARTLPYLHDLGVDWVYLSPLLEAEPGSDHGYDVVAHDRIDPARGGAEGLAALSAEARRLGMGVLVDIVPNHVGVATPHLNAWWWDLLTHGPVVAPRRRVRRRLGPRRRPGPDPRGRRRRQCRDRGRPVGRGRALPRPRLPDRSRHDDAGGAALRAGRAGGRPTTSSTTGASSRSTRWPGSGSRTARSSTPPTWRSGAGSTRGSSTGCASTTPTACATRRRTSTTWPA